MILKWEAGASLISCTNMLQRHALHQTYGVYIKETNSPPQTCPQPHTEVLHSVSRTIQQYANKNSNLRLYKVPVGIPTPWIVQSAAYSLYRLRYPGSPVSLHSVAQPPLEATWLNIEGEVTFVSSFMTFWYGLLCPTCSLVCILLARIDTVALYRLQSRKSQARVSKAIRFCLAH